MPSLAVRHLKDEKQISLMKVANLNLTKRTFKNVSVGYMLKTGYDPVPNEGTGTAVGEPTPGSAASRTQRWIWLPFIFSFPTSHFPYFLDFNFTIGCFPSFIFPLFLLFIIFFCI